MPDATAGAQGLHVSGANLTAATGIVLVVEYAFADVRDDLHVSVRMHRKPAVRSDLIVVPYHETAEPRVCGIALAVDREVVLGLEPVVICTVQGGPSCSIVVSPLVGRPLGHSCRCGELICATVAYLAPNLEKIVVCNRIISLALDRRGTAHGPLQRPEQPLLLRQSRGLRQLYRRRRGAWPADLEAESPGQCT